MITIKEVAGKAGVSIGTVDRVVHKRGRVAPRTAEKVAKVIRESGYKPNFFASRLSTSKSYLFAVCIPKLAQDSFYWEMVARGADQAKEELKPYHVKIKYFCYDRYSEKSLQNAFTRLNRTPVDGILIAPILHKQVQAFLQNLPDRLPYVFVDASIPQSRAVAFIGQDAYQSGTVAARLMDMLVQKKGSLSVILSVAGDDHIHRRAEAFQDYFRNDAVPVHRYLLEKTGESNSFQSMLDVIFSAQVDLNGIFVTNSATHYVADYIRARKFNRKIFLVGYDLIPENVHYLKEGLIDFLISQKAETQGHEGIYALYRHVVLRQPCEKNIMMPIDIITKENLIYYNRY